MTVNVRLDPEVEAKLVALARSNGESFEDFVQRLLEREVVQTGGSDLRPIAGRAKAEAFRAWAKSFPALPVLSLESISRESLYQRD